MATHQSAFLKGRRFPAERIPHAMWLAEPAPTRPSRSGATAPCSTWAIGGSSG
jgi:hypothetical protein